MSGFFCCFLNPLTLAQRSRLDTSRGTRGRNQTLYGLHRYERTAAVNIGALVIALFGIFT
ncbi:hypothetical protein VL10_10640 [Leclercia adecarboxylata]|nr:hypothetical protein VL10_10640 [Leclercia adecarboxylata]KMN64391.1 hypothetical protein VK95_15110 [Leclercia sp. LK8]